jgi:hypothetical protein
MLQVISLVFQIRWSIVKKLKLGTAQIKVVQFSLVYLFFFFFLVFWSPVKTMEDKIIFYLTVQESLHMAEDAEELARLHAKKLGVTDIQPLVFKDLTEAPLDIYDSLPSPGSIMRGGLTRPRDFNLMFKTTVGAVAEATEGVAYLRPETAQVLIIFSGNSC